ncbi:aliphatic sulfonate ABC transporter substrate-binding protein [Bacillus sp. YC2]|nr:aliphatic sulfonate ABC transporter substrate-binding protein [Bacillus sp. YC2]
MKRKRVCTLIIIAAFLSLTACTVNETNGKQPIRIGFQKGNTLHLLKESRYLEKRLTHEKIEWIEFEGGGALLEALAAGKIDYGNAADGSGIFAQSSGKHIVYVGASPPNLSGVGVVVKENSPIQSFADLKGKIVAANKGGNHHYLALLALKDAGLTQHDVKWAFVSDAAQGRAALESGEVDAFATYDPFLAGVEENGHVRTLPHHVTAYPNRTFYYAAPQFVREHPDLVKSILEETDRSDRYASTHQNEIASRIATLTGIQSNILERATKRKNYGVNTLTKDIISAQQQQADDYYQLGLIKDPIRVSDIMPLDPLWKPVLKESKGDE